TLPAPSGQPSTSAAPKGNPVDPAFGKDKLRLMDPCSVIDKTVLAPLGTVPDNYRPDNFFGCRDTVNAPHGGKVSAGVILGDSVKADVVAGATEQIQGLKTQVQPLPDGSSCFVRVLTEEQPSPTSLTIQ